ncbi:hypothetical protein [Novosphingobium terrae]|uniref:hypothetical protein n=1 Tax=Novosphingobium terrae TaxID=2726189 RepID=UPI001981233A|nr:hypothetical protein [Novosphingobium terrae]
MLPVEQIERFALAVELLGGQQAAARVLGLSEREIGDLCLGRQPLQIGQLQAISRALIIHADACRLLERRLSPAFRENVLPGQKPAE